MLRFPTCDFAGLVQLLGEVVHDDVNTVPDWLQLFLREEVINDHMSLKPVNKTLI